MMFNMMAADLKSHLQRKQNATRKRPPLKCICHDEKEKMMKFCRYYMVYYN